MKVDDIEIHMGDITRPYKVVREIRARVGAAHILSKTPTIEDVNYKLREEAVRVRANAILNVKYRRGISLTSWKALTATAVAVVAVPEEISCPFCAEPIKSEAIKCKHCGSDLSQRAR